MKEYIIGFIVCSALLFAALFLIVLMVCGMAGQIKHCGLYGGACDWKHYEHGEYHL